MSDRERIVALIHIADGQDRMVHSEPAIRHKLFAVRCVRGKIAKDLEQRVASATYFVGRIYPENIGTEIHTDALKREEEARIEYKAYLAKADVAARWLEREDPELYLAAKIQKDLIPACGCGQTHINEEYDAALEAWLQSLDAHTKRRRITRSQKA